ncbi:MAG TPA: hypothetical protein VHB69_10440 [Mycobacteriales bacterium]|nr:hypothetical protein [Mycobacteriales bacterium]
MTKWTNAADKHRVTRKSVEFVLANNDGEPTVLNDGTPALLYIAPDQTGEVIEVLTIAIPTGERLVVHAMPFRYRTPRSKR